MAFKSALEGSVDTGIIQGSDTKGLAFAQYCSYRARKELILERRAEKLGGGEFGFSLADVTNVFLGHQ